ncbi:MAG: hypothetical protein QM598_08330 [Protaetiibacter sp.]
MLAETGAEGWQIAVLIGGAVLMLLGAAGVVYAGVLRRRGR